MSDQLGPAPADGVFDQMVELRRAVHRQPELSFAEMATTELIRDHLGGLGVAELLRPTATGGIFAIDGGRPGHTVVLRADIDALPVHEDQSRPVHSVVDGVMHACGHDVHVGAALGAASILTARQEDLPGRYVFLFQPAEEALNGAQAMIDGGALSVMEDARLVGFHVTSQLPTGFVAVRAGIAMSEAHSLRITITGPGGHAAMPTGHGDVIIAAAALVSRLGEVAHGLTYEESNCVCSAGTLHAGTAPNVVPTSAKVTGTMRSFTEAQREEMFGRLRALCDSIGSELGVTIEFEVPAHTAAVVNDAAATDVVEAEAARVVGADSVFRMPPTQPSDDVSEFLKHLPGSYFFVGGGAADGSSGNHHSPTFSVEDESLRVGAAVMARSAVALATL